MHSSKQRQSRQGGATLSMPTVQRLLRCPNREARVSSCSMRRLSLPIDSARGHAGKVGDLGAPMPAKYSRRPGGAARQPRPKARVTAYGCPKAARAMAAWQAMPGRRCRGRQGNINESAGRVSRSKKTSNTLTKRCQARAVRQRSGARRRTQPGWLPSARQRRAGQVRLRQSRVAHLSVLPRRAQRRPASKAVLARSAYRRKRRDRCQPERCAASGATARCTASRAGNLIQARRRRVAKGGRPWLAIRAATSSLLGAQTQAGGSAGTDAGASQASGATAGDGQAAAQSGASSQSGSGVASQGQADDPGKSANEAAASNSKGGPQGAPETSSNKAGQAVSWFQEHTLGVITGVLALIVLIIAWLLRRVGAAKSDGRDGVITEAMVQEKLDQISLDLDEPSQGESRAPRG